MTDGGSALALSQPERRALLALRERSGPATEDEVGRATGLAPEAVRGSLQRLRAKHLALSEETTSESIRLSARGAAARRDGLPERRLLDALRSAPGPLEPAAVDQLGLREEERSAAIGILRKRGLLAPGVPFRLSDVPDATLPDEAPLAAVERGETPEDVRSLRHRGLVEVVHVVDRKWQASEEGRTLPLAPSEDAIGPLTPELLRTGGWAHAAFRPYDVRAPVGRWTGARPHPYVAWLAEFEELLVGLGFSEARGPLVETEFWNADVLFMPQEHPARSIHDVLSIDGIEGKAPPKELLDRVSAVHEGRPIPGEASAVSPGWRAAYDPAIARRTVMRSQTTAVSARFLANHPKPPFRIYSLDRNFRRDAVDATHHVEFLQCEGILGGEGTSLRDLIGTFQALAEGIGIRELRLRPSYFPFTEPSIEGYVRHPRLGWIEVFPGGLFRPEVLRPLGIEVPVAAWGIGVTRLAMVALGVSDIRELFLDDLERLRSGGP